MTLFETIILIAFYLFCVGYSAEMILDDDDNIMYCLDRYSATQALFVYLRKKNKNIHVLINSVR